MPPAALLAAADPFPDRGHGPYRFIRGAMAYAVGPFGASLLAPEAAQAARLEAILAGAAGTAFAGAHDLAAVARAPEAERVAAYRAAVPIRTYAEQAQWFDRVAAGDPAVLTAAPVRMLLETSGTTGTPKWLPVTDAWARSYKAAQELWVLGMLRDDEEIRHGKAFSIVSPAERTRSPGGVPVGSNTGRMFLAQPWWMRLRAPIPYRAYLLADPEVRAYTLLRLALAHRVTTWTTANPSTILLYCRHLARWYDDLCGDLHDGTLRRGPAAGLDAATRRSLWWWLKRRRGMPEDPTPTGVWPLRRMSCWTGGSARFFLDRLPTALGAWVPVREAGVNASEGYFAVGVDDGEPVAFLTGHFLEFVPLEGGDPLLAHEVELNGEYRLVVSTEAGLYRYDLGDVVKVTGFLGRAPRLAFVRRIGAVLDATGEKVTEDQVLTAAGVAFRGAVGVSVSMGWAEVPYQRLAVEGDLRGQPVEDAALAYDVALMRLNQEYASKRETGRLAPPRLVVVPDGTFARWRAERVAAGAAEAQVKDPIVLEPARWDTLVGGRAEEP